MPKKTKIALLIFIIALAAFFRFYRITETPPGLYPDEAINGNNALQALQTGEFKVFYPENNGREGLFINIQALFLKFLLPITGGNPEPWMLRIPSALFGILTVLGMYFLTKELLKGISNFEFRISNENRMKEFRNTNEIQNVKLIQNSKFKIQNCEIALLSAFFMAISFWHVNFSRIGFRAIMAPAFLVWGIYLLLLAFGKTAAQWREVEPPQGVQPPKKSQSSTVKYQMYLPILTGVVYGLGFHTYIAYRITPLLLLVSGYWLLRHGYPKKIFWQITGWFTLGVFIAVAPLGIYFIQHPADFLGRAAQVSVLSSETPLRDIAANTIKTIGMFFVSGDKNWRHNIGGNPILPLPITILFLIGILTGLTEKISHFKFPISHERTRDANQFQKIQPSNMKNFSHVIQAPNTSENQNQCGEVRPQRKVKPPKSQMSIANCQMFLVFWLVIASLPAILSNEGVPHALRSLLMAPPVYLFAGIGGFYTLVAAQKLISLSLGTANTKRQCGKIEPPKEVQSHVRPQTQNQTLPLNRRVSKYPNIPVSQYLACGTFILILITLTIETYNSYFQIWAKNPETRKAFNADYVEIAHELNALPPETPKYVVVEAGGILVRGIPMPAQTIMFLTGTFTREKQKEKNIHYLLSEEKNAVPKKATTVILK